MLRSRTARSANGVRYAARSARAQRRPGVPTTVLEIEDVVEEQNGALGGGEPLQHHEKRHRNSVERLEPLERAPPEVLASHACRLELIQAEARDDRRQVGARRPRLILPALPADPGVLHDVL